MERLSKVDLFEDFRQQINLTEQIFDDLDEEIVELTKTVQLLTDKCQSLENTIRHMRSGKE